MRPCRINPAPTSEKGHGAGSGGPDRSGPYSESPVLRRFAFLAVSRRSVVHPALQLLRQVVDLEAARVVVRVAVALAVPEAFRAGVMRVTQHLGRPGRSELADVVQRRPDRGDHGVRL